MRLSQKDIPPSLPRSKLTNTVPIIMAVSSDPIATGLVSSLSRPGGNVTGLTTCQPISTDDGCNC
jgi:putative ABC transport system substrate-binding protein